MLPTDPQEIFNAAVRGLAKQGRQSWGLTPDMKWPSCLYRAPNGDKCALGHVIPDDRYKPELESFGAASAEMQQAFPEWESQVRFLSDLQEAHDAADVDRDTKEFVDPWSPCGGIARNLVKVARDYALNNAVVHECWPK